MNGSKDKNKKILLIFPPMTAKYAPNPLDIPVPHIGIAYIASVLKSKGYNVDVIDCPAQEIDLNELYAIINVDDYSIIGLSTYYFNSANVIRIIRKVKKESKDIFLFLGGMLPTLSAQEVIRNFRHIDCCVVGEGELTVLELVEKVLGGEKWKHIDGIAYLNLKKEVVFTGKRKLIDDLDQLPFPVRIKPKRELYTPILASRGCYGNCTFCSIESYFKMCIGKKVRMRDPIKVVDEIEELQNQGHKHIKFNDENFNVSSLKGKQWFETFYEEIKKRNINVSFIMDMRVNEVINGKEEIRKFIDIGLDFIFIGVESFVQEHLDFFQKCVSVEENIQAMEILDELNAHYRIGLLLFNPITKLEDIQISLQIIEKVYYLRASNMMKPISIFQPLIAVGGTDIYRYVVENGLYENNGRGYKFQDDRVEVYYKICKKWSAIIDEIYGERFLVEGKSHKKEYYKKVYMIDLEFMKMVVDDMLKNGVREEICYDYFIFQQQKKIEELNWNYGISKKY